ncbi:MAG TPA: Asp23/Gls24 family envelope stress response protein [Tissierellaceae bacterium]|nr:Asp23/Gls24 family envelope stress response protein [Tissierellaceae bacterium]
MSENIINEGKEYGNVNISDDVVAIIAGVAATEISGVAGMSGGITGGITEMLGMKNLSKGVKVELRNDETILDIFIIVEYGSNISTIGKKVQRNVKDSIETMTGLNVSKVNINVQGVNTKKETEDQDDLQ